MTKSHSTPVPNTTSSLYKGAFLGLGLWTVGIPIVTYACKNVLSPSTSLIATMSIWVAGIVTSWVTVESLRFLSVPKSHYLLTMTAGTVVANLLDGIVFSYFPHFYNLDPESTVRAAGHLLWTTSWGLLIALFY